MIVDEKRFLAGASNYTDQSEHALKKLLIGNRCAALSIDKTELLDLICLDHRSTIVRPRLKDNGAGYPQRLLEHALGENLPNKDILLTPEHAMYSNEPFLLAHML